MYEDMSDFEVNSKLYDLVAGGCAAIIIPEYCTSWADIGPLIHKHGISIASDDMFDDCHEPGESLWCAHNGTGFHYHHASPLRAAAICLIKLLESKQ